MKQLITKLIIGASLTYLGWNLMNKSTETILPGVLTAAEYFCNNAIQTEAVLEDKYLQTSIKVLYVPVKAYIYTYHYEVAGNAYKGSFTSNKILVSRNQKIWYEKTNPGKSQSSDPCENYAKMKTQTVSSYSNWFLYIGFFLLLLGPSMCMGAIKNFFITLFKGARSPSQPPPIN